jgi:integrase
VGKFLRFSRGEISRKAILEYLKRFIEKRPSTYNNELKALRYFARFLDSPHLVEDFRMVPTDYPLKEIPTLAQVRRGFSALDSTQDKALYLFFATTGLRRGEVLGLKRDQVDLETRAVRPNHFTRSKRSGITFFNEETGLWLEKYLSRREDDDPRLFLISDRQFKRIWKRASEAAGVKITPQVLRAWVASELGERGVPDRYVDILAGRAPRSVIARHYTGLEFERLKRVYDGARLKILGEEAG